MRKWGAGPNVPIAHFCVRIFGLDEEQHGISAKQFALCVPPSLFFVHGVYILLLNHPQWKLRLHAYCILNDKRGLLFLSYRQDQKAVLCQ